MHYTTLKFSSTTTLVRLDKKHGLTYSQAEKGPGRTRTLRYSPNAYRTDCQNLTRQDRRLGIFECVSPQRRAVIESRMSSQKRSYIVILIKVSIGSDTSAEASDGCRDSTRRREIRIRKTRSGRDAQCGGTLRVTSRSQCSRY